MLFINKNNKKTPKIYIIDFGGYFNNVFEGLFWIIDLFQMQM